MSVLLVCAHQIRFRDFWQPDESHFSRYASRLGGAWKMPLGAPASCSWEPIIKCHDRWCGRFKTIALFSTLCKSLLGSTHYKQFKLHHLTLQIGNYTLAYVWLKSTRSSNVANINEIRVFFRLLCQLALILAFLEECHTWSQKNFRWMILVIVFNQI